MQVIPFLLAYMVGATLIGSASGKERITLFLTSGALVFVGFAVVFVALGTPTTSLSKFLFRHQGLLNQFGGVIGGMAGLYLAGILTIDRTAGSFKVIRPLAELLVGAAVALAYKPCVTPILTKIYNLSGVAETAGFGGLLILFYTMGMFTAIYALAAVILWAVSAKPSAMIQTGMIKICGAALLAFAFLVLSGSMTSYKSFLVGRFVPQQPGHVHSDGSMGGAAMDHSGHMDMDTK